MIRRTFDKILKYKLTVKCLGPLHIGCSDGMGEQVLVHPCTQKPFIQASSIAGTLRSFCEGFADYQAVSKLFGNVEGENGTLIFADAIFDDSTVKMELRPHVKLNPKTGSVLNENGFGHKFNMEYIGAGAVFETVIYYYQNETEDAHVFEQLLVAMKTGKVQFGGKRSNGAGKVQLEKVYCKTFDMKTEAGRKDWGNEEISEEKNQDLSSIGYQDITNCLKGTDKELTDLSYEITISGKTDGPLQVRGIASDSFGGSAPDSENYKNSQNEYIIPGSSIKGAIRAQMSRIANYKKQEEVIAFGFGKEGEKKEEGKRGNLIFEDVVIECNKDFDIRHRIHVDKFSGGVMYGGHFNEKNIAGKFCFNIGIRQDENADAVYKILMFALRDLALGLYNVGNGYANGKGFMKIASITVAKNGKTEQTFEIDDEYNIRNQSGC